MSAAEVTDDDKMYCETIAKSISDIIRFSLNEEYRKKSCELFGVFSTKDVENEINKRLISVLEKESTSVKKKHKNKNKNNKENVEEQNIVFGDKATDESSNSSTDTSSQTTSQNAFQKNWLRISSQRYRDVVKRKKLQCHSQPHYTEPYEKNVQFLSSNFNFHNSQPVSEVSSCSQLNEMMHSSDEGMNFCTKKFKESLRHSSKYLKRNSKYYKRIGF